jgi:hypothetical protein
MSSRRGCHGFFVGVGTERVGAGDALGKELVESCAPGLFAWALVDDAATTLVTSAMGSSG